MFYLSLSFDDINQQMNQRTLIFQGIEEEEEVEQPLTRSASHKQNFVGVLKIKKNLNHVSQLVISTVGRSALTNHRNISIVDFIEVYSYGTLLIVFAYIIAIAIIGMAYGSKKAHDRNRSLDEDSFYVAYMTSIMVVPISTTILALQLKSKLM